MRLGIIGNGTIASALGAGWLRAGHHVRLTGRDPQRVAAAANRIGAEAVAPQRLADESDAVLLAVRWEGVPGALGMVGPTLAGLALIDPTNAVEHGVGRLLTSSSAAEEIAARSGGAHVVKAFHLVPAEQWRSNSSPAEPVTVPLVGDDAEALGIVARLVADVGGRPVVLGGLERARQLEEAAGFVMAVAFAGANPRATVPYVPTRAIG